MLSVAISERACLVVDADEKCEKTWAYKYRSAATKGYDESRRDAHK